MIVINVQITPPTIPIIAKMRLACKLSGSFPRPTSSETVLTSFIPIKGIMKPIIGIQHRINPTILYANAAFSFGCGTLAGSEPSEFRAGLTRQPQ